MKFKGEFMKRIIFTTVFLAAFSVFAEQITSMAPCHANVRIPAQNIQGSCIGDRCTAYTSPDFIRASGFCQDGQYFTADARTSTEILTGQCMNGRIWIRTNNQYLNWQGRCSQGGSFSARSSFIFGKDLQGSCTVDGPFWITTNMDYFSLDAQCN